MPYATSFPNKRAICSNNTVRKLLNKKKHAYQVLRRNPTPYLMAKYKTAHNDAVKGIRNARDNYEKNIVILAKKVPKILFYLKRENNTQPASYLRNSDGSLITKDSDIASALNDTFAAVFTQSRTLNPSSINTPGPVAFSTEDIRQALSCLKTDTSDGCHELPAVFLKSVPTPLPNLYF